MLATSVVGSSSATAGHHSRSTRLFYSRIVSAKALQATQAIQALVPTSLEQNNMLEDEIHPNFKRPNNHEADGSGQRPRAI